MLWSVYLWCKMATITIDDWVLKAAGRLETVAKTATQAVAENANLHTGRGGRMRIDTGFLRNSIAGKQGSMPSGVSDRATEQKGDASAIETEIARWDVSKPFFVGWSASYARYREMRDGFLTVEIQNWQKHVDDAIRQAKARIR